METLLREKAREIDIELTEDMIQKFMRYQKILLEWNQKMNLTAITDEKEIIIKHFIDSLTIEKYIPQNASLIDVGTGAGFPGIPLKIVRNDIKVTLLDSLNKRISFLNEVIEKLELQNISTIHGRAEDFGQETHYREVYDIATARAVANLATLSELCIPFVKIGGSFICMKADAKEEIKKAKNAIQELGCVLQKIDTFELPMIGDLRTIIIFQKEKSTPKKYPRKAGIPSKSPIL